MPLFTDQVLTEKIKKGSCPTLISEHFSPLEREIWSTGTGDLRLRGLLSVMMCS